MMFSAVLIPAPEGGYTELNPETETTTEGETVEEALANLREATRLFLEESSPPSSEHPIVTTFEVATADA